MDADACENSDWDDGDYFSDYECDTYADGIDDYLSDGGAGDWGPGGVEVEVDGYSLITCTKNWYIVPL